MAIYDLTNNSNATNEFLNEKNLLPSVTFTEANSGWTFSSTPTYSDKGASFTIASIYAGLSSAKISYTIGHKIYFYTAIESNNESAVGIRWWGGSDSNTFLNQYFTGGIFSTEQNISAVYSFDDATVTALDFSFQATTANSTTMRIREAVVIDLTAVYGAGNEPTKEWCDNNLTKIGTMTNLVTARNAGLSNVTLTGAEFTHTGGEGILAMASIAMDKPIYGHKYYGRCYQKAPANFTHADARFEYYSTDIGGTGLMVFGYMEPTNDEWKMLSSIQQLTGEPVDGAWQLRSFTVNGSANSYRKEILIVDLTATYGIGNEPTKEWCDKNIPFFEGTIPSIKNNFKTGDIINIPYSGSEKSLILPMGSYKLEVWGGEGATRGTATTTSYGVGGKGGYSVGVLTLKDSAASLVIRSGGAAERLDSTTTLSGGGWNGGGNSIYYGGPGGGGSDICIGTASHYARIIVAGGGGGAQGRGSSSYAASGGAGGGASGQAGGYNGTLVAASSGGPGGTQTSAGAAINSSYGNTAGSFGVGGDGNYRSTSYYGCGGGGGGWYGGGTGYYRYSGGGGGSGYVYTETSSTDYPVGCLVDSRYYLSEASTTQGTSSITEPDGTTATGHSGNGYCRITILNIVGDINGEVFFQNKSLEKIYLGDSIITKILLGDQQILPRN